MDINISQLKPYEKNAKLHNDKQIKQVAESIRNFGFIQPIVLDKNYVIIVGHCRYEASKLLGIETVKLGVASAKKGENFIPAVLVEDLKPSEIKALRLADNKLNESFWDMGLVSDELKELNLDLVNLTGFDVAIIQDVKEDDFNAQEEYDKISVPKTKPGDVYVLGDHKLICADSTLPESYQKLLGDEKINMIFTDPPYNVDYKSPGGLDYASTKFGGTGGKIFNDNKSDEDCLQFYVDVLKRLSEFSVDSASIYWWFANKNNHINSHAFELAGWHMSQIIVWIKNSMVFSRGQDYHRQYEPCMFGWKQKKTHYTNKKIRDFKDVFNLDFTDYQEMLDTWFENRDVTSKYVHPTQKPVRLAERGLKKNSQIGDIVADVFGGSGSTLIACEQMKRKARVMELDPKYCDVIVKRYCSFVDNYDILLNNKKVRWEEQKPDLDKQNE